MPDYMGMIDDHCQNLKCCADRLFKQGAEHVQYGKVDEGKAFVKLANRIDDSREAILACSHELNRLARRRESSGQTTVIPPPKKGALTPEMIKTLDAAATEAAEMMNEEDE